MNKAFVFFYGTLQPGGWNHIRFPGLFVGKHFPGVIYGRLYWAGRIGSFPVARLEEVGRETGNETLVKGTWAEVDLDCEAWNECLEMELGAGYVLRVVRDVHTSLTGLAFHFSERWPVDPEMEITDGDWKKASQDLTPN